MEDTINLERYIDLLVKRWYIIAIGIVLFGGAMAVLQLRAEKRYVARVLLANVHRVTEVSFDTAISTSAEAPSRANEVEDRRASFVQLGVNPEIAERVLADIGPELPAEMTRVGELLKRVTCKSVAGTDLVSLAVAHADPNVATRVANSWAEHYEALINEVYGSMSEEPYLLVQQERIAAEKAFAEETKAYQVYLKDNQRAELERSLEGVEDVLTTGTRVRTRLVASLFNELDRIDRLIAAASDLVANIEVGGKATVQSSAVAIQLLKVDVFAVAASLDVDGGATLTLQAETGLQDLTPEQVISDIGALVDVLTARRKVVADDLMLLTEAISQQDGNSAAGDEIPGGRGQVQLQWSQEAEASLYEAEGELSARLEAEKSRLQQIQSRRDLAWETYNNLLRKEAELALANQAQGAYIKVASSAMLIEPDSVGPKKAIGLVGALGGVLGVFCVYAIEFFAGYRERARAAESKA